MLLLRFVHVVLEPPPVCIGAACTEPETNLHCMPSKLHCKGLCASQLLGVHCKDGTVRKRDSMACMALLHTNACVNW